LRIVGNRGLASLLALCVVACSNGSNDGVTPATPAGTKALHQDGRWLIDTQGRVVILHGVNQVSKLAPYLPSTLGFGRDDAQAMAAMGFNTIRTGIAHKGFVPAAGQYDAAYLRDFAQTVRLLEDAGLHVLIDFHQDMYNERYQGNGFADWATVDSSPIDPTTLPDCNLGFPGNMFACPLLWEANDRFFGLGLHAPEIGPRGLTLQEEYADAWRQVAREFRDDPMVFAYDLFNEPHPGTYLAPCFSLTGCPPIADAALTDFFRIVAHAVREVDGRTIVMSEPYATNFNAGMPTALGSMEVAQQGLSFHVYACPSSLIPFVLPAEVTALCGPIGEQRAFDNADAAVAATGAGLLTEFGASDDLATIQRVIDLADAHRVGWQYWAWWNRDPCCERPNEGLIDDPANPPTAEHLNQAKLDVLVRPFPRAIAGTPTTWSWDAALKRFELQ
jgi:endoglycosylceramidase